MKGAPCLHYLKGNLTTLPAVRTTCLLSGKIGECEFPQRVARVGSTAIIFFLDKLSHRYCQSQRFLMLCSKSAILNFVGEGRRPAVVFYGTLCVPLPAVLCSLTCNDLFVLSTSNKPRLIWLILVVLFWCYRVAFALVTTHGLE